MMRNLKDIFKLEDSENPSWHLDVAQECAMDGNLESMQYHLSELLYDEFAQIKSDGEMKHAFRFTKIPDIGNTWEENPVVQDILNNSITLSNPLGFNDPMDPILRQWLRIQKKMTNDKAEKNQFGILGKVLKDNLRMSCLVVPTVSRFLFQSAQPSIQDCSLLMWAHYAEMHKGLCIQYEITEDVVNKHNDNSHLLKWCKVRYRGRKVMCDEITIDNALVAKAECWSYEDESRLIFYDKEKLDSDYVTLDGFPVKAVYFGSRVDADTETALRKLLKVHHIPLYKMRFCSEDITKLKAIKF